MIKELYFLNATRISNFLFFYEQNLLTTAIFSFLFLIDVVFIGLPLYLIQLVLIKKYPVRIVMLQTNYIGHFCFDLDIIFARYNYQNVKNKGLDLYFCQPNISNKFLLKKATEKLIILPRFIALPVFFLNKLIPVKSLAVQKNYTNDSKSRLLINSSMPWLVFSQEEILIGEEVLKNLGVTREFVTLYIRDSVYKKKFGKSHETNDSIFRNSNLSDYIEGITELYNDFDIIRMGRSLEDMSLNLKERLVTDYAGSNLTSDFADFYISSRSRFSLNTDSGSIFIPSNFRKPIFLCNSSLFGIINGSPCNLYLLKSYVVGGNKLDLLSLFEKRFDLISQQSSFESLNIEIIDNSAKDIKNLFLESLEFTKGNWAPSKLNSDTQIAMNKILLDLNLPKITAYFPNGWLNKNNWFIEKILHLI